MGRANATSAHLETSTIPDKTYPFAMGLFVRPVTFTGSTYMGLGDTASSADYAIVGQSAGVGLLEGGIGGDSTGATLKIGQWHHIGGNFTSSSSWQVFVDGVGGTILNNSFTPGAMNRFTMTGVYLTTYGSQANAICAEAGFWAGKSLSAAEWVQLAHGVPPSSIVGCSHYWPIYGGHDPEVDVVGGRNLSMVSGTPPNAEHPFEPTSLNVQEAYM